ncbi:hypothetical protein BH23BAC1_BH23BAC1_21820 [soil metagenome]
MSQTSLLKWSARFLIFGGICLAIGINIRTGFTMEVSEYEDPLFLPGIILILIGTIFTLIPLPVLYAFQAERAGIVGFISFIMAYAGFAAFNIGTTTINFIWPVLAAGGEESRALVAKEILAFPLFVDLSFISMLLQAVGFILFGFATWKASIYSRLVPVLFILGGIVLVIFPIHPYNQKLGISLLSLAIILAGNHLNNEASS